MEGTRAVTRICVVRHGETPWNRLRRIQGHTDIELSETGHRQAQALVGALTGEAVTALVGSDLTRTRQTAAPLAAALGLPYQASAQWRERGYGACEGMTQDEIAAVYPAVHARVVAREESFALPGGGESLATVYARVVPALQALAAAWAGRTVVVVTHGGVLDLLNRFVRARPLSLARDVTIANASLNWFEFDGERWSLPSWGDVRHLESALDELR